VKVAEVGDATFNYALPELSYNVLSYKIHKEVSTALRLSSLDFFFFL